MKSIASAFAAHRLELGPEPARDSPWQHWRLTRDGNDIAWLLLDQRGAPVNTLTAEVIAELDAVLTTLERSPPRGLVLRSAKAAGFLAGADIHELDKVEDAAAIEKGMAKANDVVDRLERQRFPSVAVVHGHCLGGGLELALACKRRIAVAGASLGFPEVLLGLHPGLGGVVRATHLADPVAVVELMLTGKSADARKARKIGLVDAVTEERHVRAAAHAAVHGHLRSGRPWLRIFFLNSWFGRHFIGDRFYKRTQAKAPREHYPAPTALVELWESHGGHKAGMRAAERASFAGLLAGETSRNLIRIFFLRERLKKLAPAPVEIAHLHVIGAGAMGGDIAGWAALKGLRVTVQDMNSEAMAGAVKRAAALYAKLARNGVAQREALDRLIPDPRGDGLRHADVVIEAVSESIETKRKVFESIEARLKPDALVATNTSSIKLEDLRGSLKQPERFVGLHFFNPVSRMQLVELVSHDGLTAEARGKALSFLGAIDRLPVPVTSAPGFLVNRALFPYLAEAMLLLGQGVKPEAIDDAAVRFGMPVGPVELADEIGLDICLGVAEILAGKLSRPNLKLGASLRKKVEAGELGRKSGKGFYVWKNGKPRKSTEHFEHLDQTTTDRLILPILDACVACLREGVVADADLIDAAMIFGAGFAPFLGGPMHYAKTRGITEVAAALHGLAEKFGERFNPDAGWDRV